MPLTGKYDFKGIKALGAAGLTVALEATGWGAALIRWGFKAPLDYLLGLFLNWLSNKGLVLINVGAIYVNGEFDQAAFDKAMDDGLARAAAPGLTDEQKKAIDDEVRKAFRRFGRISKSK